MKKLNINFSIPVPDMHGFQLGWPGTFAGKASFVAVFAAAAAFALFASADGAQSAPPPNSITSPDTAGDVG